MSEESDAQAKKYRRERRSWYPNPIPRQCPECGSICDLMQFDNAIRLDCPRGHSNYIWESKEAEENGHTKIRLFMKLIGP